MPNKITFLLIILGSFLMSQNSEAQLSEAGEISVLTCRQGDDVYNMFGHTTIWINDPTFQINELYNYGSNEFKPGFAQKFLRGKLNYKLGKQSYNNFLRNYTNEKRSVIAQQLNLTPEQKIIFIVI
ncbi:DUF4105 domain-containing protein [uncultured Amphritea sp.]|uniref:lipoprotein N-acyltransferase Lnb domain-containing protein n=1 Tax=uncultured Amphritea sp. TaxID=981605 RepID=UPI00261261AF|nr:DUF4105 domain-containing protein [uncultured Amphritea sp.]